MSDVKFCVDCRHFSYSHGIEACYHPRNVSKPNLVTGAFNPEFEPYTLRRSEVLCGVSGLWFEPKNPQDPKTSWWRVTTD